MEQQLFTDKKTIPLPPWVPSVHQESIFGRKYVLPKIPLVIRRRLKTAEKIKVSEHAVKYRIVTDGAHMGPWRHEYAPHTVKIMDSFGLSHVREIWFCGVEQSGKTNTMMNCLSWCIDCEPGNVFYLMPTEDTAAKITGGKIKPMLLSSSRLSRYLSKKQDDTSLARIKLSHGMTIFPAHANSASAMATWSAKHCFGDEVDKYPPMAGKEADPITLIKKRNRTYKGRYKRFFASTPAGLFIHKGMMACAQVWEYRVCCPHCKSLIKMDGDHLVMDDGATGESIDAGGMVLYGCNECGVQWDDADRESGIRAGRWFCIKGDELSRPTRIGFHHRAWECLDIPLSEIASAWLNAQDGSVAERVAWANGYEAIDYIHEQQDRDTDHILRLVDKSMPRRVVPRGISCLTMMVDTQRLGFYYQVVAWGYGRDLESWRIDHGFVMSFGHLVDIAAKEWLDADEKNYRVQAAFIDSGGGTNPNNPKHSRTVEVYEFCRTNPMFKPVKGRRSMDQPWNATRLDYYPGPRGKKIPIPGGLVLYTLNVTLYKNELARKLNIEPGDPGAFHLHADVGQDYAKQMCAEYQDDHGWWLCPKNKPNHHWDIGVYGMAAADILQIRNRRRPGESGPARKVYSRGVKIDG